MPKVTHHPHGTPCWFELLAHDYPKAKTFYQALFGWGNYDLALPDGNTYTMLQIDGKDIAALYPTPPIFQTLGTDWMVYFSVTSVDTILEKAIEKGAKIIVSASDIDKNGRMALIEDPWGVQVAFWQANEHIGTQFTQQHGTVGWVELMTRDTANVAEFYRYVMDWEVNHEVIGEMPYTTFTINATPCAGLFELSPKENLTVPHWAIYFQVDDCDAMVQKATSLGATLNAPTFDVPTVGRFATFTDPQGAIFSILQVKP